MRMNSYGSILNYLSDFSIISKWKFQIVVLFFHSVSSLNHLVCVNKFFANKSFSSEFKVPPIFLHLDSPLLLVHNVLEYGRDDEEERERRQGRHDVLHGLGGVVGGVRGDGHVEVGHALE